MSEEDVIKYEGSLATINGQSFYIDNTLRPNLDRMRSAIRKDDDVVMIVDGRERCGKSVFAMQLGYYLSNGNLRLENITMTPEDFMKSVKQASKYDVLIFDEAYLGLSSRDAMSSYNKMILKTLVTVGQKNLILILVLPSVFDLSKYAVLHRADCLLHCYKNKDGQRGHFSFYNNLQLKNLYMAGKKFYSYKYPSPFFSKRFTAKYLIDEQAYRKKKLDSLNKFLSEPDNISKTKKSEQLYNAINHIKNNRPELTQQMIAGIVGCDQKTVSNAFRWYNLNSRGLGDRKQERY